MDVFGSFVVAKPTRQYQGTHVADLKGRKYPYKTEQVNKEN
jgi:hypothetical protein